VKKKGFAQNKSGINIKSRFCCWYDITVRHATAARLTTPLTQPSILSIFLHKGCNPKTD